MLTSSALTLHGTGRSGSPYSTAWQVRKEPEYYIPDFLADKNYEADPELSAAAYSHSEGLREAMAPG
jgi:hypothetical protein